MPSLARSVPKPLKIPSLARSVHKPLKVPSLARSVPKPLKVPSLASSVPKPLLIELREAGGHQFLCMTTLSQSSGEAGGHLSCTFCAKASKSA